MYETRVGRVFALFAGGLALLAVRAFALQVVQKDSVLAAHDAKVHARFVRAPRRGDVLWRDGTPIATNEPGFSVSVDLDAFCATRWRCDACGAVVARATKPAACPDSSCGAKGEMTRLPAPDADELARLLGVSTDDLGRGLARADADRARSPDFRYHQLLKDVDRETAVALALAAKRFPGVVVRARPARVVDAVAGDVVGRARDPDERDKARLTDAARAAAGERVYTAADVYSMRFGKSGLEAAFDERLRGEPGSACREARGRAPREERPVVDGSPLVTTLRRDVQSVAEDVVHDAPGDAAAVVLDLSDGGVLALASRSKDGLEHAVSAIRPGSVFKLATSLALLESGVSPDETVRCEGKGRLPGGRAYVCDGVHGDVDFTEAFAHSCNTYFEAMAERVGPDALIRACRELGLDVNPRLHLTGSACGLEWRGEASTWRPGDVAKIGIGQGKALVSPLQIAVAYGRVATGGRVLTPYLVDVEKPPTADVDPTIARFAPLLRAAARRVVTSGTAQTISELDAVEAAGKSGTGDVTAAGSSNNAWFVAFAPASNPRVVAVVVYEAVAGHGASTAGRPVARLLQAALR